MIVFYCSFRQVSPYSRIFMSREDLFMLSFAAKQAIEKAKRNRDDRFRNASWIVSITFSKLPGEDFPVLQEILDGFHVQSV